MNILLMGYYGQKNIGDDLFVQQLTQYFSKRDDITKIFVLCKDNYYSKFSNDKIYFYQEENLSLLQKLGLIWQSNYILWGGGTLKIAEKPKKLMRIQALTRLLGKKFGFLGIGLEAIDAKAEKESYDIFAKSDILYLRDNFSHNIAVNNFHNLSSICLGGDLAFIDVSIYQKFIKTEKNSTIKNISFSGKSWWGDSRGEFYAQQLIPVIEKYDSVIHLIPCHLGDERNDNRFHQLLKKHLPEKNCILYTWEKPEDYLEVLSKMDFHFGNRLHSIILADILGIPNIGIDGVGSKVANYIDKTGLLTEERRVDFMQEIDLNRIETIFNQYQRQDQFIQTESQQAIKCLSRVK